MYVLFSVLVCFMFVFKIMNFIKSTRLFLSEMVDIKPTHVCERTMPTSYWRRKHLVENFDSRKMNSEQFLEEENRLNTQDFSLKLSNL